MGFFKDFFSDPVGTVTDTVEQTVSGWVDDPLSVLGFVGSTLGFENNIIKDIIGGGVPKKPKAATPAPPNVPENTLAPLPSAAQQAIDARNKQAALYPGIRKQTMLTQQSYGSLGKTGRSSSLVGKS